MYELTDFIQNTLLTPPQQSPRADGSLTLSSTALTMFLARNNGPFLSLSLSHSLFTAGCCLYSGI